MGATPKGISGSRAASICGVSPRLVETWLKIMEEREPGFCTRRQYEIPVQADANENAFLAFGLAFEDAICKKVEEIEKHKVVNREEFIAYECVFPTNEKVTDIQSFVTCHIDGKLKKTNTLIENKTTSVYAFRDQYGEENTDQIPIGYSIQVQHNMMLGGYSQCYLYVLVFPFVQTQLFELVDLEKLDKKRWVDTLHEMGCFKKYVIEADKEIHQKLLARYKDFWLENVIGEKEPYIVDMDDLKKLLWCKYGECIANRKVIGWINEYRDIKEEIGKQEPRIEYLRLHILDYMRKNRVYTGDKTGKKENLKLLSENGHTLATFSNNRFTVRGRKEK